MTTNAIIAEQWTVELPDPDDRGAWFVDWVLRSPRQASIHLTAGYHALMSLTEVYAPGELASAQEYFAGVGAQALMIQDIFEPEDHRVQDFAAQAAEFLPTVLPRGVWVSQADAYEPANTDPADLVVLDFGDLTAWRALRPDPRSALLDRVFDLEPKAVLLTDIASRYLHLHRERYESLLGEGTCGRYTDYLEAFARKIEERWGYRLVVGYHHSWSTVMALVPRNAGGPSYGFQPTPTHPVGLELVK